MKKVYAACLGARKASAARLRVHVLKVGNSSQIFQVNHIVGPVTFAGKSQHNLVSFTTWLVLVKQTIFQLLSPEQVQVANLTRIASVLPGDSQPKSRGFL